MSKIEPVARAVWIHGNDPDRIRLRVLHKSEVMLGMFDIYTADALREIERRTIERCAKEVESAIGDYDEGDPRGWVVIAELKAQAFSIRALPSDVTDRDASANA